MHREGHLGAALLVYAPVTFVLMSLGFTELGVLGSVGAAALAMLPDQDLRVPFVKHRGPTHTVWFALLVGLVLGAAGAAVGHDAGLLAALGLFAFGFVTGVLTVGSHLLADALTPMGIRPFAPRSDATYTLDLVRAANRPANYLLFLLGAVAMGVALVLGATLGG